MESPQRALPAPRLSHRTPRTPNAAGCAAGPRAGQGIPLPSARGLPAACRSAAPALPRLCPARPRASHGAARPGGAAARGAREARRMRSAALRTPNGRHRPPRSPRRRAGGLTEAQGLEVALGVGERCTVTRAIEERRRSHPAGRRGPLLHGGRGGGGGGGGGAEVARRRPQGAAAPRAPTAARRLRRAGAGPAGHNEGQGACASCQRGAASGGG